VVLGTQYSVLSADSLARHATEESGEAGRGSLGAFRLLVVERCSSGEVLENLDSAEGKPAFPGWDVLRALRGEIPEVSAFADKEDLERGQPILLAGRFESGGVFQVTLVPAARSSRWRLTAVGAAGAAEVVFPEGWDGPAFLTWRDEAGEPREEYF